MSEPITLREDEWESVLRAVHELHRHQEDILKRLAALEDIAQTHGKVLVQLQTPPKAALEAQPVPAPEYAPGWTAETSNEYQCGIAEKSDEYPDVIFRCSFGRSTVFFRVCEYTPNEHKPAMEGIELTTNQLRRLIGAAMAILKRMEMGVE